VVVVNAVVVVVVVATPNYVREALHPLSLSLSLSLSRSLFCGREWVSEGVY
jgi:hypothetical protein